MIALLAGNLARNEAADLVAHPDPDAADAPAAAPAGGGDSQSHVKVDVAPGQELRVRIVPAALQKADDAAPAPRAETAPPIPQSSGSEGSTQRTLGWIGIGTGAAAVGLGIALRVMSSNQPSTIAACPAPCSPKEIFSDDSSQPKIVASNWAFAVGAALGATGVILELTAPSSTRSTRIAIGPTGVVLSRGW